MLGLNTSENFRATVFILPIVWAIIKTLLFTMSKGGQTSKQQKPFVLSSTTSANWKRFTAENKIFGNPSKKLKRHFTSEEDTPPTQINAVCVPKIDIEYNNSELFEGLPEPCGLDCEMVGVLSPKRDMLARVSIVNASGDCIYDKFVKPQQPVTDYRTWVSGIRPRDLKKGEAFDIVRKEVAAILKDKIVVGHAVSNDFNTLKIKHPKRLIRDTSYFPTFRQMFDNKTPSLRNLTRVVLGVNIQSGEHSSIQDAKASLQLYIAYRREWEEYIKHKNSISKQ